MEQLLFHGHAGAPEGHLLPALRQQRHPASGRHPASRWLQSSPVISEHAEEEVQRPLSHSEKGECWQHQEQRRLSHKIPGALPTSEGRQVSGDMMARAPCSLPGWEEEKSERKKDKDEDTKHTPPLLRDQPSSHPGLGSSLEEQKMFPEKGRRPGDRWGLQHLSPGSPPGLAPAGVSE